MKINKILAASALTVAFSLTGVAQHMHGHTPQQDSKPNRSSEMMGKPTAEQTVGGLRVQLWLITQDEHKRTMEREMKSSMGEMMHESMHGENDSAMAGHAMGGMMGREKMESGKEPETKSPDHMKMMEAMMTGTHHLMVKLLDDKTGKAIGEGHVMVDVTSPSGKDFTVHLSPMKDHFGGGISLTEKGPYKLSLSFRTGGKTEHAQFEYEVK